MFGRRAAPPDSAAPLRSPLPKPSASITKTGTSRTGRVIGVTQVTPRRNTVRVRGVASTGRLAYNPYGVGYYGTLGANYALQPDLSFRCDVDYRGIVRDVDINRR